MLYSLPNQFHHIYLQLLPRLQFRLGGYVPHVGILGHTNAPDALNGAAIGFAWKYTKEMEDAESGDSLHQGKDSIILRYGMLYQYRMIDAIGKSGNDITTKGSWREPYRAVDVVPTFSVHLSNVIIILHRKFQSQCSRCYPCHSSSLN